MEEENELKEATQEVAWSMDNSQLKQIADLLSISDTHFLAEDYGQMVKTLKACKLSFVQSLTKEEREKLTKLETDMSMCIFANKLQMIRSHWEDNKDYPDRAEKLFNKVIKKYNEKAEHYAVEYRTLIMDLLDSYGYLSKKKKDKTQMNY